MEISLSLEKEHINQGRLRDYAYDIINNEKVFSLLEEFSKL